MFDDIRTYFYENVWTSYKNFAQKRKIHKAGMSDDMRIALIAASALFHLREHLPVKKSQSYASLVHRCPDYELLGDIVNASKHGQLTRGTGKSLINGAEDLSEFIVSTRYKDGQGEYSHIEKEIFVKLKDGTVRSLFEIVTNVMNMWLVLLYDFGIIDYKEPIKLINDKIPARTKKSGKMDFKQMKGVRWRFPFILRRYNYETGQIEPLPFDEIRIKIYEPVTYIVSMAITDKDTGKSKEHEISVTEKQKEHLEQLITDKERLDFFMKIAIKQNLAIHLMNLHGENNETGEIINFEIYLTEKQKKHFEKLTTDEGRFKYINKIAVEQGISFVVVLQIRYSDRPEKIV